MPDWGSRCGTAECRCQNACMNRVTQKIQGSSFKKLFPNGIETSASLSGQRSEDISAKRGFFLILPLAPSCQQVFCSWFLCASAMGQGCQMVYFQTKSPNLGKFWRVLQWKMLVYFMSVWNISLPFAILYGHLVHFLLIWYIFSVLVCSSKSNLATLTWGLVHHACFHARDGKRGDCSSKYVCAN
jgi:hypothetical protein